MQAVPSIDFPEREMSEIERFCTQTRAAGEIEAARHMRALASTLAIVCLALLVCLVFAAWRASEVEQERDALFRELSIERATRIKTTLAAKDVAMSAATYELDTRVRGDIVTERMIAQERRAAELDQLAADVERQKLVEADCVTPRSIMAASGL